MAEVEDEDTVHAARGSTGIGGGLLMFLIFQVWVILLTMVGPAVHGVIGVVRDGPGWNLAWLDLALQLTPLLVSIYLLYRLIGDRRWPTVVANIAGLWLLGPAWRTVFAVGLNLAFDVPVAPVPIALSVLYACIWTPYLLTSRRVAAAYPRTDRPDANALAEVFD